ncbi:TIGR01777 family oxidoreductase [Vulgatibacter sp.]|uniref:TIGR01777 family oxidoreductase n=1 Tax=Vulgatibacter sp. TaxID=1971226 RepID=UPI0035677803
MPRTIAVTGGTGLIGRKVIDALLARGDAVVALVRAAPRIELPRDVEQREWSARGGPADLGDCDGVIHLAGAPVAGGRWTAARKQLIEASRVEGTRSVVEGIRAAGGSVQVLVSASGIDYHGNTGDKVIDEGDPPGNGFLADVSVGWEEEAMRAKALGARVVTLRTGMVLARESGALPKLLTPFRLGAGGPMGGGDQYWPWIHVADEVGLVLHALDDDRVEGPMLCVAPEPLRQRDFAKVLGKALHRPAIAPAPRFALRIAVGEMADALLASHNARPKVALETGYCFQFPTLDQALADLLRKR